MAEQKTEIVELPICPTEPPKDLDASIEVVEDLEPTVEELKERADMEKKSINEQMGWLAKTKQTLNIEVDGLRVVKQKLEAEVLKVREDLANSIKDKEVVTKKVAALEVVNVLKKNVYICVGMFILFVALFPSLTGFGLMTVVPVGLFLVLCGYHFITSKRRMEDLKRRYNL